MYRLNFTWFKWHYKMRKTTPNQISALGVYRKNIQRHFCWKARIILQR